MKNELRQLTDAELDLVSGGDHHGGTEITFVNIGSSIGNQIGQNFGFVVGVGSVNVSSDHHHH